MIEHLPYILLGALGGMGITILFLWPTLKVESYQREDATGRARELIAVSRGESLGNETRTPTATPPKVPNPPRVLKDHSPPPTPKRPNDFDPVNPPLPAPMPRKPVQQILHVHRFEVCPLCGGRPTPRDIQKEPTA